MEQNYKVIYEVIYNYTGVCNEAMKRLMASELIRVYNIYADMCNNGVTDRLNEEFKSQNPNYFEDNKGKEWYDLTEYNQFMSKGYNNVCEELNKKYASQLLEFYTNPEEVQFMGRLRFNKNATIEFFLKEV